MKTPRANLREEALRLFLTGEATTDAAIAARLKVHPRLVAVWRKDADWQACRLRLLRRQADRFLQAAAEDPSELKARYLRLWGLVIREIGAAVSERAGALSGSDLTALQLALQVALRCLNRTSLL